MACDGIPSMSNTTGGVNIHTKKIGRNLFQIDLQTGGFRNLIASYVLKGTETALVETGPSSSIPNLLSGLTELNVKPQDVAYVAVSHIHLDHGGGVGTLLKSLPNAKVVVHPRGLPHLVNPERLWSQSNTVLGSVAKVYGAPEPVPEERIIAAVDGMDFDVGNGAWLRVVETLGHASHHLSFYESLNGGIFPGDAAGIYLNEFDVVVPTTPSPFCLEIALSSLDKLANLKPRALYYSHFGEAGEAVKRLQDYKSQIKSWANIVKDGMRKKQSLDFIRKRILAEDENMRKIAPFLRAHPIYVKTVIQNSVQGFVDWVEESEN